MDRMALVSVTGTRDSWATLGAVVLGASLRLADEGRHDMARELLTVLAPSLTYASGSPEIEALEATVREEIGEYVSPDVVAVAREFVQVLPGPE